MTLTLVTGGAGFIGSNIVERLVREGEQVRVLDNLSTGDGKNLTAWLGAIDFIEGDIRDAETVRRAMNGVDFVLHQAALPSVPRSISDPATSHEVNATGTLNVLIAARDSSVKRLVYASSSSVYGNSPRLPKRESMATHPLSPYAAAKLAGENYCRAFYQVYDLETVCLRYFNVFGPRQDPTSQYAAVIPNFATAMLEGRRPVIYGDGMQSRDFTFVQNVVECNLLACRATAGAGQVYNVACSERFTLLELLRSLERVVGKKAEPEFAPARAGDVRHSLADISKANKELRYAPSVPFDDGLGLTVAYLKGENKA